MHAFFFQNVLSIQRNDVPLHRKTKQDRFSIGIKAEGLVPSSIG